MSASMLQGLNSLISINSRISDLQLQASSGKKINTASDGLAAYLSAKGYSQRADRLQNVNDTLGNNLQTVKAAKTGLESIRKTVTDALDTLKAASQTQGFVAATNIGDTPTPSSLPSAIALNFSMLDATQQVSGAAINNNTRLVNPLTVGGQNVGTLRINNIALTDGQVFSVNGRHIRISAADAPAGTTQDGSVTNPNYVKTVGELLAQLRDALTNGSDNSSTLANYNTGMANGAGNKIVLGGTGSGTNGAIEFKQTAGPSVVNMKALFANNRQYQANPTQNYTEDKQGDITTAGNGFQTFSTSTVDHAITAGTNGQAADARRAAAVKSYKQAIDQINQYLRNASVSGTNLLNGDTLKVTFDEKGTSSNFQIQDSGNNGLTFSAVALGLVNAQTGASEDIAANFATNEDAALDANGNSVRGLNAAINKLTNSLNTLSLGDSQVAQFEATVQNRVDFNKAIVGLLGEAANSLTAADMTQVSTQYAALQVQQGFAQTMMANTKQSDQSILQLLR
jgi:hypothetical protein